MLNEIKTKAQPYKKMTILFFVYFGTHNNKIHTIYKQASVFVLIFPCCCFGFISKAATTKNRQFIYDLSMLCLGLDKNIKIFRNRSRYLFPNSFQKMTRTFFSCIHPGPEQLLSTL
jgi:hypothetical protein